MTKSRNPFYEPPYSTDIYKKEPPKLNVRKKQRRREALPLSSHYSVAFTPPEVALIKKNYDENGDRLGQCYYGYPKKLAFSHFLRYRLLEAVRMNSKSDLSRTENAQ